MTPVVPTPEPIKVAVRCDDCKRIVAYKIAKGSGRLQLKCPKCGKVADLKHDNMFPLDMQYLFFCLSCHMLKQTGASY